MFSYNNYTTIEFEDGHIFTVDYARKLIRDLDAPENTIPLSEMTDHGTHYSFYYNTTTHTIAKDLSSNGKGDADCYNVEISRLTDRPQILASVYGVDLQDVQGRGDREFFDHLPQIRHRQHEIVLKEHDQELIENRRYGRLPIFQIGSMVHVVNWERKLIYNKLNPALKTEFANLGRNQDSPGYTCLFSFYKGEIFPSGFSENKQFDLSAVVIPEERVLDPIGVARDLGFNDLDLPYKHPIQKEVYAKVYHLPIEQIKEMFLPAGCKQKKLNRPHL